MKHFTQTIPQPLAEKLQKKGMPMDNVENLAGTGKDIALAPSYGKVFDWLMNEGVYCTVTDTRAAPTYEIVGYISIVCMLRKRSKVSEVLRTWHEAANDAIEKALTLI